MRTMLRTCFLTLAICFVWTSKFSPRTPCPSRSTISSAPKAICTWPGVALKQGGFGKLFVRREVSPIEDQDVIRQNRDTLYAAQVFDLDAGPVTITLPEAGGRFISMQVIDEDEYVPAVVYDSKPHIFTREQIGTRYMIAAFRILVNPDRPKGRGAGARLAGQDQDRAAGWARQVRDSQLGSRRARTRSGRRCCSSATT